MCSTCISKKLDFEKFLTYLNMLKILLITSTNIQI